MPMPQRDDLIEEIKRTDLLLECPVQHIRPRRRRRVARRSAATEPRSGHKAERRGRSRTPAGKAPQVEGDVSLQTARRMVK